MSSLLWGLANETTLPSLNPSVISRQFTSQEWQDLQKGEVLVFDNPENYSGGIGVALINEPSWKIWQVITDYPKYPDFMPRSVQSKVLEISGNKVLIQNIFSSQWPFPKVRNTTWKIHYKENPNRLLITWKAEKTNLKTNFGFWSMEPYEENKTLLIYRVNFLISWVPKPLVDIGAKDSIQDTMVAIIKRAKSERYDQYPNSFSMVWEDHSPKEASNKKDHP